ncbi:MAG TPA: ISAs1 family transposase, partial [Streptosporangiaceae bacterium]|nr:ISAs1 family transposase [Streptosporangiaceae bacterium]
MDASSLIEAVRRHLGGGEAPEPGVLRRALAARLTDRRKRRGIRHELAPVVSVLVAGAACGYRGPLAIAEAAAGWDQELLAARGCRVSPATGLRAAPSARTLYRVPEGLDADELEAALTAALADAALDPQVTAAAAAKRRKELGKKEKKRKRKPPAAGSFRRERGDGWFRPHPLHPWLDPAACGDPGHVPARHAVAADGKERKGAKAGGNKKVRLLAAVTHTPGIVIAQDRVAKAGKANEISHFKPLLAPLPLDGAVVTSDAMQANRDNALFLRKVRNAHYLWPILGSQPALNAQLNALPRETTPVSAATCEITRGRIETRTLRVLPCPEGSGFEGAEQALLIERYTTYKKKGQWHTRAEAVLYLTSLAEDQATPEDLLACVRGHWRVEHAHWLRDVIWKEDKSLIRTGNAKFRSPFSNRNARTGGASSNRAPRLDISGPRCQVPSATRKSSVNRVPAVP